MAAHARRTAVGAAARRPRLPPAPARLGHPASTRDPRQDESARDRRPVTTSPTTKAAATAEHLPSIVDLAAGPLAVVGPADPTRALCRLGGGADRDAAQPGRRHGGRRASPTPTPATGSAGCRTSPTTGCLSGPVADNDRAADELLEGSRAGGRPAPRTARAARQPRRRARAGAVRRRQAPPRPGSSRRRGRLPRRRHRGRVARHRSARRADRDGAPAHPRRRRPWRRAGRPPRGRRASGWSRTTSAAARPSTSPPRLAPVRDAADARRVRTRARARVGWRTRPRPRLAGRDAAAVGVGPAAASSIARLGVGADGPVELDLGP